MEVLYPRCAGLDVHKNTVVASARLATGRDVTVEVRTFPTTTAGLLALSAWLAERGCTHAAMEATGVYWKPVWHVLSDGDFTLVLANAAQVKNVPGRKTDVADATWLADLLAHGRARRGMNAWGTKRTLLGHGTFVEPTCCCCDLWLPRASGQSGRSLAWTAVPTERDEWYRRTFILIHPVPGDGGAAACDAHGLSYQGQRSGPTRGGITPFGSSMVLGCPPSR